MLALLACSPAAPPLTAEQQAVVAYVKAHAHDPQSYQPVRWGKAEAYTRQDSAEQAQHALFKEVQRVGRKADSAMMLYRKTLKLGGGAEGAAKQYADRMNAARQEKMTIMIQLASITDTAHIGTRLFHAYWLQEKAGAVLDSARFVVYRSGQVVRL